MRRGPLVDEMLPVGANLDAPREPRPPLRWDPMAPQPTARGTPGESAPPLLESLLAPAGAPESAPQAVERFGLWKRPPAAPLARPRVLLNMISSVDGRATLGGRSGSLSSPADRALFHALRAAVDGVLVGAGTARAERYGRIIPEAATRRLRLERSLAEEPLACIVSHSLRLDEQAIPLLAEPAARVLVLTPSQASIPPAAAQLEYLRCVRDGALDLPRSLELLRTGHGVELLLCEGGPHLARELLANDLLDELFLSLSPLLAGGGGPGSAPLRILAGEPLQPPARLELRGALRHDSALFLRYSVCSGSRVARETTLSSSLAS